MLHICGVSKTFGEWYQKTNKTEDTNKLIYLSAVGTIFPQMLHPPKTISSNNSVINPYSTELNPICN
jgi:hypothetical protein